jgi:hypothetical protein
VHCLSHLLYSIAKILSIIYVKGFRVCRSLNGVQLLIDQCMNEKDALQPIAVKYLTSRCTKPKPGLNASLSLALIAFLPSCHEELLMVSAPESSFSVFKLSQH